VGVWGCGSVGVWGCGGVGVWGCGGVGVWGCGGVGVWACWALRGGGAAPYGQARTRSRLVAIHAPLLQRGALALDEDLH
jgi:hypothetical protein